MFSCDMLYKAGKTAMCSPATYSVAGQTVMCSPVTYSIKSCERSSRMCGNRTIVRNHVTRCRQGNRMLKHFYFLHYACWA